MPILTPVHPTQRRKGAWLRGDMLSCGKIRRRRREQHMPPLRLNAGRHSLASKARPSPRPRRMTLATSCVLSADDAGRGSILKRGSGLNLGREQIEAARSQLEGWGDDRAAEAVRRSVLAALRICHHHQLNETFRTSGGSLAFVGSFRARWNAVPQRLWPAATDGSGGFSRNRLTQAPARWRPSR